MRINKEFIQGVRKLINLMLKKISTSRFYTGLIGIAIFTTGIYPAIAETDIQPQKYPVSLTAENQTTTDRVKAAALAEEIQPRDWAYQTLAALNSKYDCGNLPSQNRTLSREEFAANLNSCISSMEQLVARKPRKRPVKKPRQISPPVPAPESAPTPEVTPIAPTR